MFEQKNIVVGVTGGIAAYKTVDLVSRLRKEQADVTVIMTKSAAEFVTPLTFRSISHNPVAVDMFTEPDHWDIRHIALAEKAELFVIAPATANIIAKAAAGLGDDMLTTTLLATKAPILFVPAMNTGMYDNPVVQQNIKKLKQAGCFVMEPDAGVLACGTTGKGRMPETDAILAEMAKVLFPPQDFKGIKVLITAGPTMEAIDPVRYISNHSSGKMGYQIAEQLKRRGAEVTLVSGPVNITPPDVSELVEVTSAIEMHGAVMDRYGDMDVCIMMAAVADYRSSTPAEHKIKKTGEELQLTLTKNPDIAAELGKVKGKRILVGACAETEHLIENASKKIKAKGFDLIMANDITAEGAGFGSDDNLVIFMKPDGSQLAMPLMPKKEIANKMGDLILAMFLQPEKGRTL